MGLEPRMESLPVRVPLPKSKAPRYQGSIYATQQLLEKPYFRAALVGQECGRSGSSQSAPRLRGQSTHSSNCWRESEAWSSAATRRASDTGRTESPNDAW